MKKTIILSIFILIFNSIASAQAIPQGTVKTVYLNAKSLQQNKGNENPRRRVTIYLPADYSAKKKYPVIYYLHGFTWSDSLVFASDGMAQLLDRAIAQQKIRPFILVAPDANTLYKGSFYTNSKVNGNWSAFVAEDLVNFIDANYSTIKNKNSRGLAGHSMGGHGALKIAMLYADRFSAVYAMSPALLAANSEWMLNMGSVSSILNMSDAKQLSGDFNAMLAVALGRAFSPNPKKPPFYCDLPYIKSTDSLSVDDHVLTLWNANTPAALLPTHASALRNLRGLAFDWGSNDQFKHIPLTARSFASQLDAFDVSFSAREYAGDHGSKIMSDDGRVLNFLLPFFETYLSF